MRTFAALCVCVAMAEHCDRITPTTLQQTAAPDAASAPGRALQCLMTGDPGDSADVAEASSGGAPLPAALLAQMEAAFGADFSAVRVHEDGAAEHVGAEAFARGTNLHFARGRFDPTSTAGQELIGHELAHVQQQRAGRVAAPHGTGAPINKDASLEAEADALGARAARGERMGSTGPRGGALAPAAPIQRKFTAKGTLFGPGGRTLDEDRIRSQLKGWKGEFSESFINYVLAMANDTKNRGTYSDWNDLANHVVTELGKKPTAEDTAKKESARHDGLLYGALQDLGADWSNAKRTPTKRHPATNLVVATILQVQGEYRTACAKDEDFPLFPFGGEVFFVHKKNNSYIFPKCELAHAKEYAGKSGDSHLSDKYGYANGAKLKVSTLRSVIRALASNQAPNVTVEEMAMFLACMAAEPTRNIVEQVTNVCLLAGFQDHSSFAENNVYGLMPMATGGSDDPGKKRDENLKARDGRLAPIEVTTKELDEVKRYLALLSAKGDVGVLLKGLDGKLASSDPETVTADLVRYLRRCVEDGIRAQMPWALPAKEREETASLPASSATTTTSPSLPVVAADDKKDDDKKDDDKKDDDKKDDDKKGDDKKGDDKGGDDPDGGPPPDGSRIPSGSGGSPGGDRGGGGDDEGRGDRERKKRADDEEKELEDAKRRSAMAEHIRNLSSGSDVARFLLEHVRPADLAALMTPTYGVHRTIEDALDATCPEHLDLVYLLADLVELVGTPPAWLPGVLARAAQKNDRVLTVCFKTTVLLEPLAIGLFPLVRERGPWLELADFILMNLSLVRESARMLQLIAAALSRCGIGADVLHAGAVLIDAQRSRGTGGKPVSDEFEYGDDDESNDAELQQALINSLVDDRNGPQTTTTSSVDQRGSELLHATRDIQACGDNDEAIVGILLRLPPSHVTALALGSLGPVVIRAYANAIAHHPHILDAFAHLTTKLGNAAWIQRVLGHAAMQQPAVAFVCLERHLHLLEPLAFGLLPQLEDPGLCQKLVGRLLVLMRKRVVSRSILAPARDALLRLGIPLAEMLEDEEQQEVPLSRAQPDSGREEDDDEDLRRAIENSLFDREPDVAPTARPVNVPPAVLSLARRLTVLGHALDEKLLQAACDKYPGDEERQAGWYIAMYLSSHPQALATDDGCKPPDQPKRDDKDDEDGGVRPSPSSPEVATVTAKAPETTTSQSNGSPTSDDKKPTSGDSVQQTASKATTTSAPRAILDFVHLSFSRWCRNHSVPACPETLVKYWDSVVVPALEASLRELRLAAAADTTDAEPTKAKAKETARVLAEERLTFLLEQIKEVEGANSFEVRVYAVAAVVELINGRIAAYRNVVYSPNSDKRWSAKQSDSKKRMWDSKEDAVDALLDLETKHGAERKDVEPKSRDRKALRVVELTRENARLLPVPLFELACSLYLEWRRGSFVDQRSDDEVRRSELGSNNPGALRSWHENSEGQLPDISALPVPECGAALHRYYGKTSGTMGLQTKKDTGSGGPIGYAEYTGTGIASDAHNCKIVLDYKTGLIFITVTHYQAFSLKEKEGGTKLDTVLGQGEPGDHNPWFCFDMTNCVRVTQPTESNEPVVVSETARTPPELAALTSSAIETKKKKDKNKKPTAPTKSSEATWLGTTLWQRFMANSRKDHPTNAQRLELCEGADFKYSKHYAAVEAAIKALNNADGALLAQELALAIANDDLEAVNTIIMINNAFSYDRETQSEKANFSPKKYSEELGSGRRKVHGDHLVNRACPAIDEIELALGTVLFPDEVKLMFAQMRAFAVDAPTSQSDSNSILFPMGKAYLLQTLVEARTVAATDEARAILMVEAALHLFLEFSFDRYAEHRIDTNSDLLMVAAHQSRRELLADYKKAKEKWAHLRGNLLVLAGFMVKQLARKPDEWKGKKPADQST